MFEINHLMAHFAIAHGGAHPAGQDDPKATRESLKGK
jgi:hypothetical protein